MLKVLLVLSYAIMSNGGYVDYDATTALTFNDSARPDWFVRMNKAAYKQAKSDPGFAGSFFPPFAAQHNMQVTENTDEDGVRLITCTWKSGSDKTFTLLKFSQQG